MMDIEARLRRFELGESHYVEAVAPVGADELAELAQIFGDAYKQNSDLRLLNAILKIVDRDDFRLALPLAHAEWSDWAHCEIGALRVRKGLA